MHRQYACRIQPHKTLSVVHMETPKRILKGWNFSYITKYGFGKRTIHFRHGAIDRLTTSGECLNAITERKDTGLQCWWSYIRKTIKSRITIYKVKPISEVYCKFLTKHTGHVWRMARKYQARKLPGYQISYCLTGLSLPGRCSALHCYVVFQVKKNYNTLERFI